MTLRDRKTNRTVAFLHRNRMNYFVSGNPSIGHLNAGNLQSSKVIIFYHFQSKGYINSHPLQRQIPYRSPETDLKPSTFASRIRMKTLIHCENVGRSRFGR